MRTQHRQPRKRVRRIARWATLATILLLTIAWIASAWKGPQVGYVGEDTVVWVAVCAGQLCIRHNAMDGPHETGWGVATMSTGGEPYVCWWFNWDGLGPDWFIYIPLWIFWLPLAALTTHLWWPTLQSRRWRRSGRCPTCGYDPTGLATDAACPECGTTLPPPRLPLKTPSS